MNARKIVATLAAGFVLASVGMAGQASASARTHKAIIRVAYQTEGALDKAPTFPSTNDFVAARMSVKTPGTLYLEAVPHNGVGSAEILCRTSTARVCQIGKGSKPFVCIPAYKTDIIALFVGRNGETLVSKMHTVDETGVLNCTGLDSGPVAPSYR